MTKTYLAEIAHSLSEKDITRLENGTIELDNERILPASVEVIDETFIKLHIQEGRFHQVKRMLHAVNNEVISLKRIAMKTLYLDDSLAPGEWRFLSEEEIRSLKEDL